MANIIYDSRSGISVVAFRTAPPVGGLSCSFSIGASLGFLLLPLDELER